MDFNNSFYYNRKSNTAYAYYGHNGKASHMGYHAYWSTLGSFKTGDIITIHLDLDNYNIAFERYLDKTKETKDLGIAFSDIEKIEYRLAVTTWSNMTVELLSYKHD